MPRGRKRRSLTTNNNNNTNINNEPQTKRPKISNDDTNMATNKFPMIFDWNELNEIQNPQTLKSEALKKQERGKYVRRDSLSSEQAADRRRKQNRESARRTRDRVRKYITVLEMYYNYSQNVNSLLIKQLQIMKKYCNNQLTDNEKQNLKIYPWPQKPNIEQCINSSSSSFENNNDDNDNDNDNNNNNINNSNNNNNNNSNNSNNNNQIQNHVSAIKQNKNQRKQNQQCIFNINNPLQQENINISSNNTFEFEQQLLQCGISLNNQIGNVNPQIPQIHTLPNGQLLINPTIVNTLPNTANIFTFQTIPQTITQSQPIPISTSNNNIISLNNINILPNTY